MYSYATNGSEGRSLSRDAFLEYIHDLQPPAEKMANQPFETNASLLMDELDAFRAEFGKE